MNEMNHSSGKLSLIYFYLLFNFKKVFYFLSFFQHWYNCISTWTITESITITSNWSRGAGAVEDPLGIRSTDTTTSQGLST
uniref:Uncharacterized protein n=1 Tax=Brugia malayi TaxID=6279 RepID=A8P789_BRUMA